MDASKLTAFIDGFYGYGTYSAPYWFIGMEEGGCRSFSELEGRVSAWHSRGSHELEDLGEYHAAIGVTRWFGDSPNLQTTWKQISRCMLAAEGARGDIEDVRDYQATRLARRGGGTCLLELLPLPVDGIGSWPYEAVGSLGYLSDRETYKAELLPRRLASLLGKARQHRPRSIVCYGLGYLDHWAQLADQGLVERRVEGRKAYLGAMGATPLLIMQHPAARGVASAYFEAMGRLMARA